MEKNAIVLCSGGLDSVTTAHYVKKKLGYKKGVILFFNYLQKSAKREREFSKECAKDLCFEFMEIKLEWLGKNSTSLLNKPGKNKELKNEDLKNTKNESEKFYVPYRNGIFLFYALGLAEGKFIETKVKYDIFVGFKCEGKEPYPDTTKNFVREINKISEISSVSRNKVFSPLIKKDKEDIIILGEKLGVDYKKTYSCYVDAKMHCGKCLSCKLRQQGFYWANKIDPTVYRAKNF